MNTEFDLDWTLCEEFVAFSIEAIHTLQHLDDDQISQGSHPTDTTMPTMLSQSKKIKKNKANKGSPASSMNSIRDFWTGEEDAQVIELYNTYGPKWAAIASIMKTRTRKQIRDRYNNSLRPDINVGEWTPEEEEKFTVLYEKYGNKWCQIAAEMPGRTENQVKNKFHRKKATIRKIPIIPTQNSLQNENHENLSISVETPNNNYNYSFFLASEVELDPSPSDTTFKDSFNDINYQQGSISPMSRHV